MTFATTTDDLFFHVFSKSISNYRIFGKEDDVARFLKTLIYYNGNQKSSCGLGTHLKQYPTYDFGGVLDKENHNLLKIICYCVMPDHYHLVVRAHKKEEISQFISLVENSYTRYFNIKHNRKGPLWQNRFKAVRITSNSQLLHVTRYVHINPTTANLVKRPEDWVFSSYKDYITSKQVLEYMNEISIQNMTDYKKFAEDQIDYQKQLKFIKKHLL